MSGAISRRFRRLAITLVFMWSGLLLTTAFGRQYLDYKQRTPMLLPLMPTGKSGAVQQDQADRQART